MSTAVLLKDVLLVAAMALVMWLTAKEPASWRFILFSAFASLNLLVTSERGEHYQMPFAFYVLTWLFALVGPLVAWVFWSRFRTRQAPTVSWTLLTIMASGTLGMVLLSL